MSKTCRRPVNYREKRELLKKEFENRKLAKKINIDGYFCSLHDLTRNRLVFVCCRKTSTRCKIKVHITWDGLEEAGFIIDNGVRVTPNIVGMNVYEIKGKHSPECVAKHDYLQRKAQRDKEEMEAMRKEEKQPEMRSFFQRGSENSEYEEQTEKQRMFALTLDSTLMFRLQDGIVNVDDTDELGHIARSEEEIEKIKEFLLQRDIVKKKIKKDNKFDDDNLYVKYDAFSKNDSEEDTDNMMDMETKDVTMELITSKEEVDIKHEDIDIPEIEGDMSRVMLLGSRFMIKHLMKCKEVLIDTYDMSFKSSKDHILITFFGISSNQKGIPCAHLFLQQLHPKLITEGLRMLRREINVIKLQENDSTGELEKQKDNDDQNSQIFCHVDWEKVYCTGNNKFVTDKLKLMIPDKVDTEDFELTWTLRNEAKKLNLEFNKKLDLIISICQILWRTGIEQQSSLYQQLLALTTQETNPKIKDLVSHFQLLINQRNDPKDDDLFDVSETKASPEFKFQKMIQKELKREGSSFETLYNILRFYEQEHRNKSISGALTFKKHSKKKNSLTRIYSFKNSFK